MNTVLVVGGAGYIGSKLCKELCKDRRNKVVCVDNLSTGDIVNIEDLYNMKNFTFVSLDSSSYKPWKVLEEEAAPLGRVRCIYYLATATDPMDMIAAHIDGLKNFLNMANFNRSKILYLSMTKVRSRMSQLQRLLYETKRAGEAVMTAFHMKFRVQTKIVKTDKLNDKSCKPVISAMIKFMKEN